jgi:hypothetical protein
MATKHNCTERDNIETLKIHNATMAQRIETIEHKVTSIDSKLDALPEKMTDEFAKHFVSKTEFEIEKQQNIIARRLVFGLAAIVLIAVVTAWVTMVVR